MMDNELLRSIEHRVTTLEKEQADVKTVIHGRLTDGINGGSLIHVMARMVETMYGPKDDPGGLVHGLEAAKREARERSDRIEANAAARHEALKARLDKHDRLIGVGAGIIIALQVAWAVFTHFHK